MQETQKKQNVVIRFVGDFTQAEQGTPQYIKMAIMEAFDRCHGGDITQVFSPALLEQTGGIVQSMSGSPVIQNGKLIGAITHVLVDDPTTGYAIFAENMLETAQTLANKGEIKDAS